MLNRIIDASPTLKRFLQARAKGASEKELKRLQAADEAARDHRLRSEVIIPFSDREPSGVKKD